MGQSRNLERHKEILALPHQPLSPITIQHALEIGETYIDRRAVRDILIHTLDITESRLIGFPETIIPLLQWEDIKSRFERAKNGEPIPYITGTAYFYGYPFRVTPDTLIPRPETEMLIVESLRFLKGKQGCQIIDVGTGSGCIPITLGLESEHHHITATDISQPALAAASDNTKRHKQGIQLVQADLLAPFQHLPRFDLIIANLPYVADSERALMDQHVLDYEPHLALFSEDDGLAHIFRLLQQAKERLKPAGMILLEFGFQQGEAINRFARQTYPTADVAILKDLSGHDRVLMIKTGANYKST